MKNVLFFLLLISLFHNCKDVEFKEKVDVVTQKLPVKSIISEFELKTGDILFQDSDCGPFCDAIEKVTFGKNGAKFSHVGMVVRNDSTGSLVVLEAISKGVVETELKDFFSRSHDEKGNSKVVVGRLKQEFSHLNKQAILEAKSLKNKPYDDIFDINNDAYYCSELIYWSYKKANNNQAIFQLRPMTYKDPETKKTFPIWEDYFKELNEKIPENEPGLNPGSMSKSIYLEIVHLYGIPTGWRQINN